MIKLQRRGIIRPESTPVGQRFFTASATFYVPTGVFSICAVAIGAGRQATNTRSGGGGALAYTNDIPVIPGEQFMVDIDSIGSKLVRVSDAVTVVGAGSPASATVAGQVIAGTGFRGGLPPAGTSAGEPREGAGAGGYTGPGGDVRNSSGWPANGGGGSSPYGGTVGGLPGGNPWYAGGDYGGGGAKSSTTFGPGGPGCVRIIWGSNRRFPNTNTEDKYPSGYEDFLAYITAQSTQGEYAWDSNIQSFSTPLAFRTKVGSPVGAMGGSPWSNASGIGHTVGGHAAVARFVQHALPSLTTMQDQHGLYVFARTSLYYNGALSATDRNGYASENNIYNGPRGKCEELLYFDYKLGAMKVNPYAQTIQPIKL